MKGKRTKELTEELGGKVGVVVERIQGEGIQANQRMEKCTNQTDSGFLLRPREDVMENI